MSLFIRPATLADAAVIAEFNMRLAKETEDKDLDPAVARRGVERLINDGDKGWYRLACIGDVVVGQYMISLEWSDWRDHWIWWLQSVYVRHDHRGTGVFRALYAGLVEEAKAAGVGHLRLYVEHDNLAGQRTYQSLGMIPTTYQVYEMVL